MCLLSSEQAAWSWCFQTFRGCEEVEPWPEVFYQPLCLNSELRKDQSPIWEVFLFHLIFVSTASLEIMTGKYFCLACV